MTKRYDDPIDVTPDPGQDGAPLSFRWRGRRYDVDQWLMTWREAGEWWLRHGRANGTGAASNGNGSHAQGKGNGRRPREQQEPPRSREREPGLPREREYFRVLARPSGALATGDLDADGFMRHPGAVFDVYLDRVRREWRLARIWD